MAINKISVAVCCLLLLMFPAGVFAGDFDWMGALNTQAKDDPTQYRSSLSERFNMDSSRVKGVLDAVGAPADAYMVMRMAELSGRPTDFVLKRYRDDKKKGWGALAKDLGIKPGSREFHALKQGHDLYRSKKKDQDRDVYDIFDTDKAKAGGKGKNQQGGPGRGKK